MGRSTLATLVVPTYNAGPEFPTVLCRMQSQVLDGELEVLVIDSGSTDGTVDVVRSQPVRLLQIPNRDFNHGLTRQLGIEESRGDIVVLATQDALPADEHWIQGLVRCFEDPEVAGAYSRQIPRADANPFVRDRLSRWAATRCEPRVQKLADPQAYAKLSPRERLSLVTFDNVSSAVRRSIATQIPFRACTFGEDMDWAERALLAGYEIVYAPASAVIHSHNDSLSQNFKRIYLDHQNLRRMLGLQTIPRLRDLLRCSAAETKRLLGVVTNDRSLSGPQRFLWASRVLPLAVTENLAQFLGARSGASKPRHT